MFSTAPDEKSVEITVIHSHAYILSSAWQLATWYLDIGLVEQSEDDEMIAREVEVGYTSAIRLSFYRLHVSQVLDKMKRQRVEKRLRHHGRFELLSFSKTDTIFKLLLAFMREEPTYATFRASELPQWAIRGL